MAVQRICDPMLPELSREFNAPIGEVAQVISVFAIVYGLMQQVPRGDAGHLGLHRGLRVVGGER